jgi:hypothetical protein
MRFGYASALSGNLDGDAAARSVALASGVASQSDPDNLAMRR